MRPRRSRPSWSRILLEGGAALAVYIAVLYIGDLLFPGRNVTVIVALVAMIVTLMGLRAKRPKSR